MPHQHRHPARPAARHPIAWALALAFGLGAAHHAQAQSLKELYEAARGYDEIGRAHV